MEKGLPQFRAQIDALDEKIVGLLAKREKVVRAVGEFKSKHDILSMDPERKAAVTENFKQNAVREGLNVKFAEELYELIHKYAIIIEESFK